MFSLKAHKYIYFWSAILIVVGLSLSKFLMSVGTISLFVNWLLEGQFKLKFSTLKSNKIALSLIALFSVFLIGLLWTEDVKFGMHDLKLKAPILAFSLVFGTKYLFNSNRLKQLLLVFVTACFTSVLISFYTFFKLKANQVDFDLREISIFISHIRQSMMVVFSIIILAFYLNRKEVNRYASVVLIFIFVSYLLLLQSLTGLLLIVIFALLYPIWNNGFNKKAISFSLSFLLVFLTILIGASYKSYNYYFTSKQDTSKDVTEKGSKYTHYLEKRQLENGHFVWRNLAEQEIKEAWEERSNKSYFEVNGALIRFITSLGLPKDASAVNSLSLDDIRLIESGKTSRRNIVGLSKRIDEFLFELAAFKDGQNPSNNSISQRLYAWCLGSEIIKKNALIGIGTGDTQLAFNKAYESNSFKIDKKIRAHNQFLTLFICFGLIGGLICFFLLMYPLLKFKNNKLFIAFYLLVLLSFFVEDTLETQPGVLFYGFFMGLFLQTYNAVKKA